MQSLESWSAHFWNELVAPGRLAATGISVFPPQRDGGTNDASQAVSASRCYVVLTIDVGIVSVAAGILAHVWVTVAVGHIST